MGTCTQFSLINQTLGLELNTSKIISSLKKSRLNAILKGKKIICTIPAYRFDIFGPMDLVEEVALGYGIQNFEPTGSEMGKTNVGLAVAAASALRVSEGSFHSGGDKRI